MPRAYLSARMSEWLDRACKLEVELEGGVKASCRTSCQMSRQKEEADACGPDTRTRGWLS